MTRKQTAGNNLAWFDYSGNILIEGYLEENSDKIRTSGDEWIIRNNNEDALIFDIATGNLYVDGTIFENQGSLTPSAVSDNFIVKDSDGTVVLYINQSGSVFLKGSLTSNATLSPPDNVLFVRNSSGVDVATIDDLGNMVIKGALEQNSNHQISNSAEWIVRNNNEDVLVLDKINGNLYIDQTLFENQGNLQESNAGNDFIVKDPSGSIVLLVNQTGSMFLKGSLNENGILFSYTDPETTSTTNYNYTFDANGNIIQDESNYYEYNDFNQLIKVRGNNSNGAVTEEYLYDGNNQRLMKISYLSSGGNNSEYYFDETFVKRVNSTGVFNEEYVYHDSTLIATIKPDGTKEFSHPDHLGSTTLITNFSGNLVEETTYYPFGSVFEGGNSRYTYTGKEIDSTGLSYYGARYYSADILRRFTQADTLILDIYNPQALNRNSYVLNNPYKYVDPTGREPIVSELIGYNSVINQIRQIEQAHPDYNARQTLITFNYRSAAPTDSGKSFIYTSDKGFIDNQHFFANAKVGAVSAELGGSAGINALISGAVAIGGGYAVELGQGIGVSRLGGKESTFSYEDL